MNISSQFKIGFNYAFTKASNELLAKIFCEQQDLPKSEMRKDSILNHVLQCIESNNQSIILKLTQILKDYKGQFASELCVAKYHNKIPDVFLEQLAKKIGNETVSYSLVANYLALGTGVTAPAAGDSTLETETVRGQFTSRAAIDNVSYLDKFFSTTEVGGNTYNESGIFIDGTGTADSGLLLSRVAISETIGSTETLTVNATITFSSAT